MEVKSVDVLTPIWVNYLEFGEEKTTLMYFNYLTKEIHCEKVTITEEIKQQILSTIEPEVNIQIPIIPLNSIAEIKSKDTRIFGYNPEILEDKE